jgi:hypothetical protein
MAMVGQLLQLATDGADQLTVAYAAGEEPTALLATTE